MGVIKTEDGKGSEGELHFSRTFRDDFIEKVIFEHKP